MHRKYERCVNCLELKLLSQMYFDPDLEAYFCTLLEALEYKTTRFEDRYERTPY